MQGEEGGNKGSKGKGPDRKNLFQMMEIRQAVDRVHNYVRSPLFPWNFLLERMDRSAIEHYSNFSSPASVKIIDEEWMRKEVSKALISFLMNPESERGARLHGKFAHLYPFAYPQCIVFSTICAAGKRVGDFIDLDSISTLVGVTEREVEDKEKLIQKCGIHTPRVCSSEILGRKVVDASGREIGKIRELVFEDGELSKVHVLPRKDADLMGAELPEEFLSIPSVEIILEDFFNDFSIWVRGSAMERALDKIYISREKGVNDKRK